MNFCLNSKLWSNYQPAKLHWKAHTLHDWNNGCAHRYSPNSTNEDSMFPSWLPSAEESLNLFAVLCRKVCDILFLLIQLTICLSKYIFWRALFVWIEKTCWTLASSKGRLTTTWQMRV
jgi:hypothetical protein